MSVEGCLVGFGGFRSRGGCIGGREIGLVQAFSVVCCGRLWLCFKEKRRLVPFSVPGHGPFFLIGYLDLESFS
jgi:hypothetical protein